MRRLFSLASAISLLICAASAGLWLGGGDLEPRDPPLREMQYRLNRFLTETTFDQVEFRDVMDFIREVGFDPPPGGGLHRLHAPYRATPAPFDLDVDWRSIEVTGVNVRSPITYSRRSSTLGVLLAEIANSKGLRCRADATLVHVSTPSSLAAAAAIPQDRFLYTPRDLAVRIALGRTIPGDIRGSRMRLDLALDMIRQSTGVDVEVDWDELKKAGVLPDAEIVPDVGQVTIGNFLAIVLRDAHGPGALLYEIRNGAVIVSTPGSFHARDPHQAPVWWIAAVALVAIIIAATWVSRRGSNATERSGTGLVRPAYIVLLAGGVLLVAAALPSEGWEFEWLSRHITFAWGRGVAQLWVTPSDPMRAYEAPPAPGTNIPSDESWGKVGFSVLREAWPFNSWRLEAPCATAAAIALALPWFWSLLATAGWLRRRRWQRSGHCRKCGYDLRAATAGRCPECGNVAPLRAPAIIRPC